ncbi:universal stress protein [Chitinophaga alhagiae]|uniref:universal stress protein n=1 Tax=Chitinophaga alhagiae TaxID=2203219 RepID=UPI000E5AD817|nr:universal stress protein [Chitinophaga alhagiae]
MKKILFLTDAMKPNIRAIDFAAFVCNMHHTTLTCLLLGNAQQGERPAAVVRNDITCAGMQVTEDRPFEEQVLECMQRNIQRVEDGCECREVAHETILISGKITERVLMEARYADMLLLDASFSFGNKGDEVLSDIAHQILHNAECPVVLVPDHFEGLDQVVFAYDASPSSVYAIKQFTAAFPMLSDKPVVAVTANGSRAVPLVEKLKMKGWLDLYYQSTAFHQIEHNSYAGLLNYVLGKDKIMMVMGAYGRKGLSALISSSHADMIGKYVSWPVFISHI